MFCTETCHHLLQNAVWLPKCDSNCEYFRPRPVSCPFSELSKKRMIFGYKLLEYRWKLKEAFKWNYVQIYLNKPHSNSHNQSHWNLSDMLKWTRLVLNNWHQNPKRSICSELFERNRCLVKDCWYKVLNQFMLASGKRTTVHIFFTKLCSKILH